MKDYVLLKPLDVTDGGKKTTKPPGTIVNLNDELARWLDDCEVISIDGTVKPPPVPSVARFTRSQPPPRKRCCGW